MGIVVKKEFDADTVDIERYMTQMGKAARDAAEVLAYADPEAKNRALVNIGQSIDTQRVMIQAENERDMQAGKSNGLEEAMLDRLLLSETRIDAMIDGLHQVAALTDPVGEISELEYRPSGIQVGKMRVPLGVIGIIYESRPDVTIEAAVSAFKAGNSIMLKGGKEAKNSNLRAKSFA